MAGKAELAAAKDRCKESMLKEEEFGFWAAKHLKDHIKALKRAKKSTKKVMDFYQEVFNAVHADRFVEEMTDEDKSLMDEDESVINSSDEIV